MEAGKEDDEDTVAPQLGDESVAQAGTPSGDLAAEIGEQGVTPIPEKEPAAQEGTEEETAAQEGPGKEAPAGEATAEDPAALPADVAALLQSPGMVETLQRMVAEATAKA